MNKNDLKRIYLDAFDAYKEKESTNTTSDLLVHLDSDAKRVYFYDDLEELLFEAPYDGAIPEESFIQFSKETLQLEEVTGMLESLCVIRPFSVILVDADYIQKKELLTLQDSETVLLSDVLADYNDDLDLFLKHLMEE